MKVINSNPKQFVSVMEIPTPKGFHKCPVRCFHCRNSIYAYYKEDDIVIECPICQTNIRIITRI